jgi:hypothetical protein
LNPVATQSPAKNTLYGKALCEWIRHSLEKGKFLSANPRKEGIRHHKRRVRRQKCRENFDLSEKGKNLFLKFDGSFSLSKVFVSLCFLKFLHSPPRIS